MTYQEQLRCQLSIVYYLHNIFYIKDDRKISQKKKTLKPDESPQMFSVLRLSSSTAKDIQRTG